MKECWLSPCANGGICFSSPNSYLCYCLKGYYGNNCQFTRLDSTKFVNSTILTNVLSTKLINLLTGNKSSSFNSTIITLKFQASVHGFSSTSFHSKCDGILGTLFVAKSPLNSNIFGGYTEADWSGNYQFKNDPNAFLFSLVNSYNKPVKMPILYPSTALFTDPSYGPTFGSGYDANFDGELNFNSFAIGSSYELPSFLKTNESIQSFLGGAQTTTPFVPFELEVYSIRFDRKCAFNEFISTFRYLTEL